MYAVSEALRMLSKFLLVFLLCFFHIFVVAQTQSAVKKSEQDEKLIKTAISFLRETSADVDRMRSIENRLSFGSELASLMWFHDEKSARAMYDTAINDFKLLLANVDAQLNSAAMSADGEDMGFSLFGPGRSIAERKIRIAMMVRQQIALSLVEHDPDMAYSFFYETAAIVSNPQFRRSNEESDRLFETQLVNAIAEKDAANAVKYGKASLKDGIDGNHIELLKKIYRKDAEKGVEFGQAIFSKVKADSKSVKGGWIFYSLLTYGAENLAASKKPDAKKPIFSQGDLSSMADVFAQTLLGSPDNDEDESFGNMMYVQEIEKFSPARGAQLRSKYRLQGEHGNFNLVANAMNTAGSAANMAANMMANSNSAAGARVANEQAKAEREKELAESMKMLAKSLSKEEREKIVDRARTIVAQTKGAEAKIAGLSLLAAQVAKTGDMELADEIMRDADRLVNPFPKNYRDYLLSWLLAGGYAEANPAKAFPLLESTILRANDTIAAFAKVAEFIDVNEEMISDGEVQVGAFGGTMLRGMTRELGIANTTLVSLAKADFAKTKAITESFDRIEVRVLAKMLVLRALLDEKKPKALVLPAGEAESTVSQE